MKTLRLSLILFAVVLTGSSYAGAQECSNDPAAYIGSKSFFINNEPLAINGRQYSKYGLPRVLTPTDVVSVGTYAGSPFFAVPGSPAPQEVIYILVRKGCEFQPYVLAPRPACGIKASITATPARRAGKKVYVFTASPDAASRAKKLTYQWSVAMSDDTGLGLPAPETYVIGASTGKTFTVATKKLKKGARIKVTLKVAPPEGGCEAEDVTNEVVL
jgi:hypothetical protein